MDSIWFTMTLEEGKRGGGGAGRKRREEAGRERRTYHREFL